MRDVKYLLIGGGLAAIRGAQQIRTLDPDGSLLIVCDEPMAPYDRPPLSKKYLAGQTQAADLLLEPPEKLAAQKIECVLGDAVTALDAAGKIATLSSGEQIKFEKAMIATGGRATTLDIAGADLGGIYYLRTAADADALRAEAQPGRKAVIIGGGFIGLETAATLNALGVDVTIIEALPRALARLGNAELSDYVAHYCAARGVKFMFDALVSGFRGEGRVNGVTTSLGDTLDCDFVCIGVGLRPNVELAVAAGLDVDDGVVVNEQMRTSHPDIYAAGDVINYFDPLAGRRQRAEHWGHAEHSGQIAGRAMAGGAETYDHLPYVWSDIFDLHIEFAGDAHEHDAQVRRGAPESGAFLLVYLKEGVVRAFFSVNFPAREYAMVRRMIQKKTNVGGREAQLADMNVALRSLL
ncbi:MAG: NAD(P)/FAD-dependent oxidoreductase [Hyphomonadaceae bacterium]